MSIDSNKQARQVEIREYRFMSRKVISGVKGNRYLKKGIKAV